MRRTLRRRTYRDVWQGIAAVLLAVGWLGAVLARPISVSIWSFGVLSVMWGLGTIMYELRDGQSPLPNRQLMQMATRRGAAVGAGVVAFTGFVAFARGWALLIMLVVAATSPQLLDYLGKLRAEAETLPDETPDDDPVCVDPSAAVCAVPLRTLTTTELCRAWRASFLELQQARTRGARMRIVDRRQSYLDELQRRNPAGFEAWLDAGARAASDPGRFI